MELLLVPYLLTIQTKTMSEETRPFKNFDSMELLELLYCLNFPNGTFVESKRDKFIALIMREHYLQEQNQLNKNKNGNQT